MMNSSRAPTSLQSLKHPLRYENERKMDIQGARFRGLDKARAKGKQACREKKLALLQDVDRLKKKLGDEENIHRALQRVFNRPLGYLPRLPPYFPQNMLELVAEIAVLEEEVVRLEEQVVTYRQYLTQDAVLFPSKSKLESPKKNSEHNLERASTTEQSHSETASVSVVGTASNSSNILSDRSSLSLDKTVSTSSDITSDQTGQTSSVSSGNEKARSEQKHSISENGKGRRGDQLHFKLQLQRNIQLSERKSNRKLKSISSFEQLGSL